MENKNFEEQKYIRAKKKVKAVRGFYIHFGVFTIVNSIFLIVNSLLGDLWSFFWDWYPMLAWGIGVIFHAYSVFGRNLLFGKVWEERKIKEMMDEDNNQKF